MASAEHNEGGATGVGDKGSPIPPPRFEETIGHRDLRDWPSTTGRALLRAARALEEWLEVRSPRWTMPLTVLLTALVGGLCAATITYGAAEVYEAVVGRTGLASLDQPVLDWVASHRSERSSQAITAFTNVGGSVGGAVLAVVVLGLLVARWRRWTPVIVLAPALAGALAITLVGKELTGRARPPRTMAVAPFESSASFPSGHTLNATVLAALGAYLLLIMGRRAWSRTLVVAVAAAYAGCMGLSRVWLGHHWLTDVVAGWLLGLAWVVGVVTVHRLVLTLRSQAGHWPLPSVAAPAGHGTARLESRDRNPEG